MTRIHSYLVAALAVACLAVPGPAAQMVRHSGGDGGNLVILREIGVVAGPQEGSDDLEVVTLLPDAAGKSEITIERGDLLLMAGGKRIRDIAVLKKLYEEAAVGDTIKLGFRRGDERFLVSFEKEEQREGEMRMVMMGGPGGDGGEMQPFMEVGVVLTEAEDEVRVGMEMPTERLALETDDVIVSINGQAIDSIAAFRELYEAAEIGDDLEIVYVRGGEEHSLTRAKIDASGMVRVRRGS